MEIKELKWGIIGPGQIAEAFIQDLALVTGGRNTVTAVMSNTLRDAKEFASHHGNPACFDSVSTMIAGAPPDIVYIASPHSAHYQESIECLRRGVPVLCEKPLAINSEQVAGMIEASRSCKTFLMEGMWIRFLPSLRKVLQLLEHNVIGKVNSIVADMSYEAPKDEGNRFYDPALGGGSLLDLGIYPVYLSLLILGMPESVKASARLSPKGIDESCAVILEYADGVYALLESSIIKDTGREARIYGEKGCITLHRQWNEKPAGITVSLKNGNRQHGCEWSGRGFQFEVAEIISCLSEGRIESSLHSHRNSRDLMSVLDEIRKKTHITYPADEQASGTRGQDTPF